MIVVGSGLVHTKWLGKMLCVLAYMPPPGLTTSHECLQSFPAHSLSHHVFDTGNDWINMRITLKTTVSDSPSPPRRLTRTSSR